MKKCPHCGAPAQKVIYLGFPMLLCPNEQCSCMWGFWSWIAIRFQIEDGGWGFMGYDCSYWRALWFWLMG